VTIPAGRDNATSRTRTTALFRVVVQSSLILVPRAALACPVCFGNSDAPMAIATNTGIMAMLVVVAGVLGAFASFFIYLMRRQRLAASMSESRPADAGHYGHSEGTA
jgi:hypothetical protein